ncbi:MAG: hypothetical protein HN644_02670 [Rhodospirillales bacterium]|jgi:hypothetical protein|nr:hypothetical protein [Rhodospirillales bacterium]MBT4041592.1 hypothetical protein [Rhodospirillales bacterium]MBT4627824.1 hypothetical protein [Rhodospirillales bacterium]MBT5352784.1 hypothetical protein [Rhodospirillales bacterium]MBT5521027.1 hypothetical protein [Rhodospirillales bacterium]
MQIDTPEQNLAFAMANKPASGTSSTASKNSAKVLEEDKEPSVIDEIREKGFMAYVEEIHAKRMEELRSKILEAMGLNEEQLAEMSPEQRGMIEDMIAEKIKQAMLTNSAINDDHAGPQTNNAGNLVADNNIQNSMGSGLALLQAIETSDANRLTDTDTDEDR